MSKTINFVHFYKKLLKKHFVLVQGVQTGFLMGTGDFIAQTCVEKRTLKTYEPRRTLVFTTLGFVFIGPTISVWFRFMNKHIGDGGRTVALKKVACDQLLFAPCILTAFITIISVIQGKDFKEELRTKYRDVLLTNFKIWPAAQIINFSLIPLSYQVLYVQIVALAWNVYLSWKTQQK